VVEFDPTNDKEINEQYISVGVGRDYADVTPLKGINSGGGSTDLDVVVEITGSPKGVETPIPDDSGSKPDAVRTVVSNSRSLGALRLVEAAGERAVRGGARAGKAFGIKSFPAGVR